MDRDDDRNARAGGSARASDGGGEEDILAAIRRFRRLSPSQKIRATVLNNRATRRILELGAGELRRSD